MDTNIMDARDAVYGSLAECYITIEGNRYKFMQLYEFEASWEVNIKDIPILGKVGKGHKAVGASGEWSGTAYYNQSIMRRVMKQYQDTGKMISFDIQVTNEDPTSQVGRQTVILKDCLIKGGVLAKFNAGEETLDEELSGTFETFEMPETYKLLPGMK